MVKKGKITTTVADPKLLINFHFTNSSTTTSSTTTPTSSVHHHHHHHGTMTTTTTTTTRPQHQQQPHRNNNSGSYNHHNHTNKKKNNYHHRTAEDRVSARKRISTQMFPLHSSPDHAFVISRRQHHNRTSSCGGTTGSMTASTSTSVSSSLSSSSKGTTYVSDYNNSATNEHNSGNNNNNNNNNNNSYTFQGPDRPVSWESVRIVKCFIPIDVGTDENNLYTTTTTTPSYNNIAKVTCPICLDDHCVSPRITKCGHIYCYTCILHHIQTYHDKTTNPKCPCCLLPIYNNDLRPIQIIPIGSPTIVTGSKQSQVQPQQHESTTTMSSSGSNSSMRFIKLHRIKHCSTPYIPTIHESRHGSPYAIPCHVIDNDDIYCKFNYLHIPTYIQLLQQNLHELQVAVQQQQHHHHVSSSIMEEMILGLAIQSVQQELNRYQQQQQQQPSDDSLIEMQLQQQYSNVGTGFYSPQIPSLIYNHHQYNNNNNNHNSYHFDDTAINHQQQQQQELSTDKHHIEATNASSSSSWDRNGKDDDDVDLHNNNMPNEEYNGNYQRQRDRGNSVSSIQSNGTCNNSVHNCHGHHHGGSIGGSIYATDEEYIFYQANDGSLCFLSGFNMNCLRTEFASTLPTSAIQNDNNNNAGLEQLSIDYHWNDDNNSNVSPSNNNISPNSIREPNQNHYQQHPTRPPLPDIIDGHVVVIERVQLTPEMRERRRFLSHIPLYTDVTFIEIDLNHILSHKTKQIYKKEFKKRQQVRMAREKAEQKEDALLQQFEQQQIDERKARMQRIDPMDDFFQPVLPIQYDISEPNMLSEDFGPTITSTTTVAKAVPSSTAAISFSQVCQSGEIIPKITAAPTEMNFPALGSSPPNSKTNMITMKRAPPPIRPCSSTTVKTLPPDGVVIPPPTTALVSLETGMIDVAPPVNGKKNKNKKILLFSTGAHRNDYF